MSAPHGGPGFADVVARAWRKNILLSAHFELTYACNLDCTFCYNDRARADRERALNTDEWCAVVDDLAELGVLNLALSGGEPTVHPGFFQIGARARERGFVVRVKSNGLALHGANLARLIAEVDPFVVEVSLHGATAATHDRQTQVRGSFARLLPDVRAAIARGVRVQVNTPLTAWNEHEVEPMIALVRSLGVRHRIDADITPKDDGSTSPLAISATPAGLARWLRASLAAGDTGALPTDLPCDVDGEKHCGAGSANVLVDPFGDVLPCVQWRRKMGNVREAKVSDIWRSGVFDDVRASLVDVKRALAGERDHCPGVAEQLTGSLVGITPNAAKRRAARASLNVLP